MGGNSGLEKIGGHRGRPEVANGVDTKSLNSTRVALRGCAPPRRHVIGHVQGNFWVAGVVFRHWGNGSSGVGARDRFTANLGTSVRVRIGMVTGRTRAGNFVSQAVVVGIVVVGERIV